MQTLITESQFQATVVEAAQLGGWLIYHTHRSDRSESGFPDLVLVRPPRIIFAELKREGRGLRLGRLNKAKTRWLTGQDEWAEALAKCDGVEYYTWMPSHWEQIQEVLIEG
jgi:hypothetical protein